MPQPTMFDRFPAELLYEVFEYLTTLDILHAFHGINRRTDSILSGHVKHDLNFRSKYKAECDFICERVGPGQIRSLVLSDADDTVRQINWFFRQFYIRQLVQLESLSLHAITERDWNKLSSKLHYLTSLSHLSIHSSTNIRAGLFPASLRHLTVSICSMNGLHQWLTHAPNLTTIDVQLVNDDVELYRALCSAPLQTDVRRLKVRLPKKSGVDFGEFELLFSSMTNLTHLTVIAVSGFRLTRADRWEYLIRSYLPYLRDFRFKFNPILERTDPKQLLAAFQTPFWLVEHRWQVYCDYHRVQSTGWRDTKNVHLYTLPYCHDEFYLCSSATALTDTGKEEYATIGQLYFTIDGPLETKLQEHFHFPSLHSLTVQSLQKLQPINDFVDLSRVKHLAFDRSNTFQRAEFFACIVRHATSLQSLSLSWQRLMEITNDFADAEVCAVLRRRIKSLHFVDDTPPDEKNVDERLQSLIKIFANNLEKLDVQAISLQTIVLLLNRMPKLSSIRMEYNIAASMTMNNDQILLWLTQKVSRLNSFTYQTRSISQTRCALLLWINA